MASKQTFTILDPNATRADFMSLGPSSDDERAAKVREIKVG